MISLKPITPNITNQYPVTENVFLASSSVITDLNDNLGGVQFSIGGGLTPKYNTSFQAFDFSAQSYIAMNNIWLSSISLEVGLYTGDYDFGIGQTSQFYIFRDGLQIFGETLGTNKTNALRENYIIQEQFTQQWLGFWFHLNDPTPVSDKIYINVILSFSYYVQ